jgi:hypothetical protein
LNSDLKTGFSVTKSIGNLFGLGTGFLCLNSATVNADVMGAVEKIAAGL